LGEPGERVVLVDPEVNEDPGVIRESGVPGE